MNPRLIFFHDITPLRKLLLMKAAALGASFTEYEVTGNPAAFETNVEQPLTQLLIPFTPIQSGTGDPSPSNVRNITGMTGVTVNHTGKNLFDTSTLIDGKYIVNDTGEFDTNVNFSITPYISLPEGSYTFTAKRTVGGSAYSKVAGYDTNKNFISILESQQSTVEYNYTFTIPNTVKYIVIQTYKEMYDIQLEFGSVASAYEPYTGSTYPVTFPAMGKNLFSASLEQGGIIGATGVDDESGQRVRTHGYIFLKQGTYTVSATGVGQAFYYVYDNDKTFVLSESSKSFQALPRTITLSTDRYIRIAFRVSSSNENVTPSDVSNAMLNAGSTAEAYEPYTNTIYGGSSDVVTGELVVEWKGVLVGDLSWSYETRNTRFYAEAQGIKRTGVARNTEMYCSAFVPIYDKRAIGDVPNNAIYGNGNNDLVYIKTTDYTDTQAFKTEYGSQLIVYPLATPITYQLTPQQIKSLIGDNTIWSDTNGENTIKYLKKG